MNTKRILISLSLLVTLSGCNQILDYFDNWEMACRDKMAAHHAWKQYADHYENVEYRKHFAKGFRQGYMNVLGGGNGCQPALPPRWYWKVCYQNPEGQEKIRMWFNGWSHGALVAEQDGLAQYTQIPVAPTIRENHIPMDAEHDISLDPEPDHTVGTPGAVPPAPASEPETPRLSPYAPRPVPPANEYDPPVLPDSAEAGGIQPTSGEEAAGEEEVIKPAAGEAENGTRILEKFEYNQ